MIGRIQAVARRKALVASLSALIVIFSFVVANYLTGSIETSLAVGGLVSFFASALMLGLNEVAPSGFSFLMVAKSSPYSSQIAQGVREVVSNSRDGFSEVVLIEDPAGNEALIQAVEQQLTRRYFATVAIRPLVVDKELADYVKILLAREIFVILLDLDIPDPEFGVASKRLPYYVGSDHKLGGSEAFALAATLTACENTYYLALLGPDGSPSAESRGRSLCWSLMRSGCYRETLIVQLPSWSPQAAMDVVTDALEPLHGAVMGDGGRLVVFCPNDNICKALAMRSEELKRLKMFQNLNDIGFVGYDGLRGPLGDYALQGVSNVVGTVDSCPELIGREAALAAIASFERRLSRQKRQFLVQPVGVPFT